MIREAGIHNIGAWGYDGCAAFDSIASERPRRCWDILGEEYQKLLAP